ncbi:hairy/enhancer-of-split related with YRPW motif protein-like [Watersipora subatra]|uniref:hairy/enhancer-of-split related with YRPW motif protein-like n=1 Tax=Watersipora subatra TaxID=2589382 RepID=UPI00355B629E
MLPDKVLKRRLSSDSDSEYEEEQCNTLIGSPLSNNSSDDSGCFHVAKKKRRGLIEKRRRDRINRSLNDLKKLIPTAHERQASAKLEKSEVLSLAVEHIKSLTGKLECANPQNLAMDYRSIGYRECIGDTISYLVHGEGRGPTDQLHTRLISHLNQQLSANNQSFPATRYCNPPNEIPQLQPPVPPVNYLETMAVCKPEPPISPSYCGTVSHPPADYNSHPQYSTECLREQTQWLSSFGCSNDSSSQFCSYTQPSWV